MDRAAGRAILRSRRGPPSKKKLAEFTISCSYSPATSGFVHNSAFGLIPFYLLCAPMLASTMVGRLFFDRDKGEDS